MSNKTKNILPLGELLTVTIIRDYDFFCSAIGFCGVSVDFVSEFSADFICLDFSRIIGSHTYIVAIVPTDNAINASINLIRLRSGRNITFVEFCEIYCLNVDFLVIHQSSK